MTEQQNAAIPGILLELGIVPSQRCYSYIFSAITLALEDENRLLAITQEIYAPVARQFSCQPSTAERNMRTAALYAWQRNPAALRTMAGCPLDAPPTGSEFLEIIVTYLQRMF